MAELKKTVLGKVSGAVGDIVFRERDGKNYIGLRPDSFIPGTDPASVARRQRFLLTLKSGSAINTLPPLKALWNGVKPSSLSAFNYIVKTNYRYVTSAAISDLLKIVPDNGFGVTLADSNVDRTRVRILAEALGTNAGINIALEPTIMMACIVFLSSPVDESVGAYSILSAVAPALPTSLTEQLTFDADLSNQQSLIFDKYQITKTFIAIVTLDSAGLPVHYSSTVLLS
jgi:hypothetical protein